MATKNDLIAEVSRKVEIPKATVEKVLATAKDTIVERVAADETFHFRGFGKFEKRHRAARKGHNPQTGDVIDIPETEVPAFSPSSVFKEAVKN